LLITFDLDGTLIDSSDDLANSVNAMLMHFNRRPIPADVIQTYVGNGADVLVRRALGDQTLNDTYEKALAFFLDYYGQHSLEYTGLYTGVRELIEDLKSMDHQLAVLTNKPVKISEDILKGLKLGKHFFRIYGGDSFPTKKPDPAGLLTILSEAGVQPREALLIGDSAVDVQTAHNSGVRCCGVTWGFQPQAIQSAGADLLISKPHQLMAYI
jgi:phosphoglycolate phosphatase